MPGGLREFIHKGRLEVNSADSKDIVMRTIIYIDGDVQIECANSIDSKIIEKHNRIVARKLTRVLSRISIIRKAFVMIPVLFTLGYVIKVLQIDFNWTAQVIALLPAIVLFPLLKWLMALACRRWVTKFLV
jgi:hypothetical protein